VIGAAEPTGPDAPQGGGKDDCGQEEEDSGNFKPEDSANATEGAQECADAAGYAASGMAGDLAGGAGLGGDVNRGLGGVLGGGRGGSLGAGGDALACDATGNAEADAERSTDDFRFHSVYDGNSDRCQAAQSPFAAGLNLPPNGDGSMVKKSCAAIRARAGVDRRS